MSETKHSSQPGPLGEHEARLGDRGDASGRNIQQNRAIGQDDPMKGSRQGREANKKAGFPGGDTGSVRPDPDKSLDG